MSDGFTMVAGVKRCNGCTKHREIWSGEHWCGHPDMKTGAHGMRIGMHDRTPAWCPLGGPVDPRSITIGQPPVTTCLGDQPPVDLHWAACDLPSAP